MKKLSEINEGMFSGMVRRANSDQVKKEDDAINDMDREQFFEYIMKHYIFPYDTVPKLESNWENEIRIPIINGVVITYNMNKLISIETGSLNYKNLNDVLKDKFFVKNLSWFSYIHPKESVHPENLYDVDNTFFLTVLDALVETGNTNQIKKNEEVK